MNSTETPLAFIQATPGLSWLDQMREIYQTNNIYRTIIIVDDAGTASMAKTELVKDNHSVFTLRSSQYSIEFQDFLESGKRVLILEYEDYKRSLEDITYYLMDQHNLLILENLERFQEIHILDFVNNMVSGGFLKFLPYRIWIN